MSHSPRHLGQSVDYPTTYSAQWLERIPRQKCDTQIPMYGVDLWHAYEFSWLNALGCPQAVLLKITVPSESPYLIESKSMKLYFNSFNQTCFDSREQVLATVIKDLSTTSGTEVKVSMHALQAGFAYPTYQGFQCLDDAEVSCQHYDYDQQLLQQQSDGIINTTFYSEAFRSHCPVTNQPDWATIIIHWHGVALEPESLLRYIVSFRTHQDFHESCVERMFTDLSRFSREACTITACFSRRGGIDIHPIRSTHPVMEPHSFFSYR